jgi:hypothetical protein
VSGQTVVTAHLATVRTVRRRSAAVRDRIFVLSNYVVSGYMSDQSAARGQALMALGQTIEQQPLIAANSDVLVALGVMLVAVSWLVLLARKGLRWRVRAGRRIGWRFSGNERGAALAFSYPTAAVTHSPAVFQYDDGVTAGYRAREVSCRGLHKGG